MFFSRFGVCVICLALLSGCLVHVGDFGAFWEKGKTPSGLLGKWVAVMDAEGNRKPPSFVVEAVSTPEPLLRLHVEAFGFEKETVTARSIHYAGHDFLMVWADKELGLAKYTLQEDVFTFYPYDPGWANTPHRIERLNEQSLQVWLQKAAKEPKFYNAAVAFKRVD